jgi:hypothetical protein
VDVVLVDLEVNRVDRLERAIRLRQPTRRQKDAQEDTRLRACGGDRRRGAGAQDL